MEAEPPGEYLALVVEIGVAADDRWYLTVDGTGPGLPASFPLRPATLVLRLWRTKATGTLRGSIRLRGSEEWAPIQSNGQLERLLRVWLADRSVNGTAPK